MKTRLFVPQSDAKHQAQAARHWRVWIHRNVKILSGLGLETVSPGKVLAPHLKATFAMLISATDLSRVCHSGYVDQGEFSEYSVG